MLISAFAAGSLVTVQASPTFPWSGKVTFWAVVDSYPYFGFGGGYHALLDAIKTELANIGITLNIQTYDSVWDICWDTMWNVSGDADSHPETYTYGVDGWDFTTAEWSTIPTGLLWVDEFVYKTPPEGGYNAMEYCNPEALALYNAGTQTLDPIKIKENLWYWQELFMNDPPMINLYYGRLFECTGVYVEGWDSTVWFYDTSHFGINKTAFDLYAPEGRKAIGSNVLFYGVDAPIWGFNPLFTLTYTEEMMRALTHDNLYTCSRLWDETKHEFYGPFVTKPVIAAGLPEWRTGPHGPNTVARITIRHDDPTTPVDENIYWSDHVTLNASDVWFTYDLVLDKSVGSWAYADFSHVVDHVEIVDPFTVDFVLYAPRWDLVNLLSSDWGVEVLPWHQLKDVPRTALDRDASNTNPYYLVGSGPYKVKSYESGVKIEFEKNPYYFGYKLGWGPYVDTYIMKWVPDPGDRRVALETLAVDYCEYPMGDVSYWQGMQTRTTHKVWTYMYHGSNPLYMNLHNPILSNRYVRMAIAQAIPYHLFPGILETWGIPEAWPGVGTFIVPTHGELYNTKLVPYEYSIDKAIKYMEMWWYSREDATLYTLGPVGDGDFSGKVDTDDFVVWANAIVGGRLTPDKWIFKPGRDIDPDYDNTNYVEMADYYRWREKIGYYYPERSLWWQWSRTA